jgi:uncharacterized membrane protein YgcG
MKKIWIIMMVCILLLAAGCGKQAEETQPAQTEPAVETVPETTQAPPETTEETIPVPQTRITTALVDRTPAVLAIAMRGDTLDVVGEYDENHYVVKMPEGYGLVRREYLRLEGEEAYEPWTAYAYWNAEFYTDLHLTGEPARKLTTNTKVEVLDDLGYCYVVQVEETVGYIRTERLTKWPISSGGSGDGGSGGGGGGSGQDGGDISLRWQGGVQLLAAIEQTGDVTGTATVLADGTQIILGYFDRGEEMSVVTEEGFAETKEGYVTLYLDGLYAWVAESLVAEEGAEAYAQWDGYARWSAAVYDNFHLIGSPVDKLNTNTKIHVVHELDNCYMVQVGEVTGFMAKDMISKTRYSSGGGSSDGGSGGGGGGGGDWSPPQM